MKNQPCTLSQSALGDEKLKFKFMLRDKKLLRIFVYVYTFFVIYMPRISDLFFGVQIEIFSVILLMFTSILWIIKCKSKNNLFKINKHVLWLFSGIIISSAYFSIRAIIGSYDIRLMQNLFVLVQIVHVLIITDLMKYLNFTAEKMIRTLLNLALLQGIITLLMIIFPNLKEIALSLYYVNLEENIFISRMRIYGISGDYTFFTPIYHGLLSGIALFYSVYRSKKYFLYLPFILLVILMNGRFGILVFLLAPIILAVYLLVKGKVNIRALRISFYTILVIGIGVFVIRLVAPYTYDWIVSGVMEVFNLVIYGEKIGNVDVLRDMLHFPKGVGFFWGEGHRIIGRDGRALGYTPSDIGYVNDMFMGGVVYVFILYGTIISFITKNGKKDSVTLKSEATLSSLISKYLLFSLLLANFKGEVMRGGLVLVGAIFIKLILMKSKEVR